MKSINILIPTLLLALSISVSKSQTEIVNGGILNIKFAPYQVSIEDEFEGHQCGGVIISDRWILTAAHCLTANFTPTIVHAGSSDQTDDQQGQRSGIETIYPHPDFFIPDDYSVVMNDIGLIYLSTALQFNENVQPVKFAEPCWFDDDYYLENGLVRATGWGQTETSNGSVPLLRSALLPNISVDEANEVIEDLVGFEYTTVTDQELAFFDDTDGGGSWSGDSGGPWVQRKDDNRYNIGVTAWGYNGIDLDDNLIVGPSIAAKVSYHSNWIESICGFVSASPGVDLYIKDREWDMANEPSGIETAWISEDIWVRNQPDGLAEDEHQNPIHDGVNPSYCYVRVRNNGCLPSEDGTISLYWAKASTALAWPSFWDGSLTLGGNSAAIAGDTIGTLSLGGIEAGGSQVYEFEWNPPDPSIYQNINDEPWHFCLLARVESAQDPISVPETSSLYSNVISNNNIAWKNLTVIDFTGLIAEDHYFHQGTVSIGNGTNANNHFDFYFDDVSVERLLLAETEVICEFDQQTWNKLIAGGIDSEGFKIFREGRRALKMISPSAHLKNIPFAAGELGWANMKFNFLTRTATENQTFLLDIKQVESSSGEVIGGERYQINKKIPDRYLFAADAGGDQTILQNESVILQAQPIGESAEYNWYDQNGVLLHTGLTYRYQSDSSAIISLEVIADIDGYKDYHDISVAVQAHSLTSIVPNPASNSNPIQVSYDIDPTQGTDAYLQIVEATSGSILVVPLNLFADQVTISSSLLGQGNFSVVFIVDDMVVDQLNLLVI